MSAISVFTHCGSSGSSSNTNSNPNPTTVNEPFLAVATHVVIVVLENQSYSEVIGNPLMPFLNNLATQNALATQFYADAHPSISDYFMMTTGQVVTFDNNFSGPFTGDNVVRQLTAAGKTWKVYAESLPSVGYLGNNVFPYAKHHNPFPYFENVIESKSQASNIVPFSQFAVDANSNALPNYSFIVPNELSDGHSCADGSENCPLSIRQSVADQWLSANIGPLAQNSSVMQNTILLVTFDEAEQSDITNGGGHIALILAGAGIKAGYQSTTVYQFPGLLRFTLNSLGVTGVPGAGANAWSMNEFYKSEGQASRATRSSHQSGV